MASDCTIVCQLCEHHYRELCWLNKIRHRCECGRYHRCVEYKNCECESCGANGTTYGSKDKSEDIYDDASIVGNGGEHPWHGIDFDDDFIKELEGSNGHITKLNLNYWPTCLKLPDIVLLFRYEEILDQTMKMVSHFTVGLLFTVEI
jgi:hypothetical protein